MPGKAAHRQKKAAGHLNQHAKDKNDVSVDALIAGDAKKFVAKLDFLTTPGYLTGPGAREEAGLPANTGPHRVISDLAVMDFDPATKRMRVLSLHPGKTLDQVQAATGFEMLVSPDLSVTPAPTDTQLHVLRTQVDPGRYILSRGG